MQQFAIYKGDVFLFIGTKKQCAEFLKVKEKSIAFYATPAYKRRSKTEYNQRLIVIRVPEN